LKQKNAETVVKALFLDYDGTISRINVPLSESRVPSEVLVVLNVIRKRIPVAVITTKALDFVVDRTPFACAWSALGGLETKVGDVTVKAPCLKENAGYITAALQCAKEMAKGVLAVEEKMDYEGEVVAFSVDWRFAKDLDRAEKAAVRILSFCATLPVVIVKPEGQPFFDVFPCAINKGKALLELKQKLGVQDGVLYMGDSPVDNSAFEAADISVGVVHAETAKSLASNYFVRFDDVADFLRCLLENDFCFSPSFPMIFRIKR
jgi:trehalose-phosphatase